MKPVLSAYQRYKAHHIRCGLCIRCSRKPERGLLRCRVCLERKQKLHMARHSLFSSLAQTDALTKFLIEKGLITQTEFMQKL